MRSPDSILQASDFHIHLWKRFKAGDSEALGQLAQVHYRALYNYATRFSSDPDFIRDSIQDMYLELWERRKNLSETHFVKSYLLKALRHKLIKESIRLKRFQEPQSDFFGDDQTDPSIEAHIIEDENLRYQNGRLKQIITLLSKRQREIIYLRFYQNLDNESIASIMGLGRQSVSNLLSRTLKDIKEIWVPAEFVLLLVMAAFC